MEADGCSIEELATHYLYQRRYGWNGTRWQIIRPFPHNPFWTLLTFGGFLLPRDAWILWLQWVGLVTLLLLLSPLYRRLAAASPIFNLGLSMAVATIVLIVTTLWLFNQG
jgi:hypothetical protein